ncbi:AIM24 family protein [Lusitaniella coriacea LEGE 07157]|uniref:AIM24 family protein n=1 Tax=Lusitaniella coriacea LEGE 07157 TaxID=945747 RepID=A0A8J7ARB7_9CYAN|nr:AIM24 family protein [Lusitaniella coriacea]MBE9114581.1 AIM24 family protein [Lusitaniella coriacea LEGE 07157]
MIYTYETLPRNDRLNRFSYCLDVSQKMFIRNGAAIAYYGSLRFESIGSSLLDMLVQEAFNAPRYVNNFVIVTGQGKLLLGDRGLDLASYDLTDAHFTVKSSRVVAFDPSLICQESTLHGYLTFLGTGQLIASSNGPVHFLEPPVRVDPDAVLGWSDAPSPSYHYDYDYIKGILSTAGSLAGISLSGEEKQLDFIGQGTVLVQSSER